MDDKQLMAVLHQGMRITNYFESEPSRFEPQYGYWARIGDGRDLTAGFAGFVSKDTDEQGKPCLGDLFAVFTRFGELEGHHDSEAWSRWISDPEHFALLARTSHNFRQAQLDVYHELYGRPAIGYFRELKLQLEVGLVIIEDTLVQHGEGKDLDSFGAILSRSALRSNTGTEAQRLSGFLSFRQHVLQNPNNHETEVEWRKSIPRVRALRLLLQRFPHLTGDYESVIAAQF